MSDRITERPGWDEYFMEMAEVARKRSTCLRRAVGAIIVKDNRILATGYNGVPSGIEHCSVRGCQREALHVPSGERHELCRGIHAEQNAIVQAAYLGVSIDNATLYCTNQPCILCAKMIINAGIKRIVIKEGYPDAGAEQMLAEAGLRVEKLGESSAKAPERSADHVLER
ncbi:MAG: cytidine/deoxycytidylate deaminase family protein [Anaerovoracaceae bacterium]